MQPQPAREIHEPVVADGSELAACQTMPVGHIGVWNHNNVKDDSEANADKHDIDIQYIASASTPS
jgi:hypothetical protein